MSEIKNNEVVEVVEVEETEKVGFGAKVKGFCKKHKVGLIIGGVVATALAVVGIGKAVSKSSDTCDDYDYEEDDIIDSTAEVIEDAE